MNKEDRLALPDPVQKWVEWFINQVGNKEDLAELLDSDSFQHIPIEIRLHA